jgi:hypothetical protein
MRRPPPPAPCTPAEWEALRAMLGRDPEQVCERAEWERLTPARRVDVARGWAEMLSAAGA